MFVKPNGTLFVAVGEWIKGEINGQQVVDAEQLRELLEDEFNLPEGFEFVVDEHWNIGHGWSGDKF